MFAIEKVYSSNLNEGGCQLISQAANSTFTQRRKVCDFIQFQKTIQVVQKVDPRRIIYINV